MNGLCRCHTYPDSVISLSLCREIRAVFSSRKSSCLPRISLHHGSRDRFDTAFNVEPTDSAADAMSVIARKPEKHDGSPHHPDHVLFSVFSLL